WFLPRRRAVRRVGRAGDGDGGTAARQSRRARGAAQGLLDHSAWARVRAGVLGVRGFSRQFRRLPAYRPGARPCRARARLAARRRGGAGAGGARGGGLSDFGAVFALALAVEPAAAAFPVVGRLARRAGAGARLDAAGRSALSRPDAGRRLRGGGVLGVGAGPHRRRGAETAWLGAEMRGVWR